MPRFSTVSLAIVLCVCTFASASALLPAAKNGVLRVPLKGKPNAHRANVAQMAARRMTVEGVRRLRGDLEVPLPLNGTYIPLSSSFYVPQYAFPIAAGTPPQVYHVVPDSGSNYVGLAGEITQQGFRNKAHTYDPSSSSSYEPDTSLKGLIDLQYGGGGLIGPGAYETFGVAGMTAKDQGFIQVEHVSGTSFIGPGVYWEGIWGLCFQGLYRNATQRTGGAYFKPMLQTLFEQKELAAPTFGFYLASDPASADSGEIQFGAPDDTRYTGDLHYVDILPTYPTENTTMTQYGYWLHSVDGVSIDGRNITVCETNSCIGFVDTGGPLLNVPLQVAAALIPYVHINANCSGLDLNPTLSLNLNGKEFPLTPEDYVYKLTDPTTGVTTCELGINVLPGANNFMFQIGDTFLRKYYAYFVAGDKEWLDNPRIGFATAVHN